MSLFFFPILCKIFGGIFRCYAVALALFVAVVETEWSFIMKFWRVMLDSFDSNVVYFGLF